MITLRLGKTTYTFIFKREKLFAFLMNLAITYALNLIFDIINYFLLEGGSSVLSGLLYLLKLVLLLSLMMWAEKKIREYLENKAGA